MKLTVSLLNWPAGKDDFSHRVKTYHEALGVHAQTVDEPRPAEDSLVESADRCGWEWEGDLVPKPKKLPAISTQPTK